MIGFGVGSYNFGRSSINFFEQQKRQKEQEQANSARTTLSKAGVNTSGMSQSSLLSQYNNGYSMIKDADKQTAEDYFSRQSKGSEVKQKTGNLLSSVLLRKRTLLGGYGLADGAVLGG